MKYLLLVFLTSLWFSNEVYSQNLLNGKKSVEIPFDYVNNFIIINVVFNEKLPLKFIFDTGAEHTILTKREYSELSGIQLDREFKIVGADLTTEITAYLARNVSFKISRIFIPTIDILVFKNDYFKFEELTGVEVHGIIGANIFGKFVLDINYNKRVIKLHDPFYFTPPNEKYAVLPITVFKSKPYLVTKTKIDNISRSIEVKLLIDTGASLTLLLYTDTHSSIIIPPNVIKGSIGLGLGGHLEGYLGRIHELEMSSLKLNNIVTSFQEIHELIDTSFLNGRNGIVGNLILDRFDVIIDYQRQKLFLKPTKKFKEEFKYDRSGLSLIASGKDLTTIVVNNVIANSPADEAGIQKGDIIKKVNWIPSAYLSMKGLLRLFQKNEGKKIKITVNRNGQNMKFEFQLRDLI